MSPLQFATTEARFLCLRRLDERHQFRSAVQLPEQRESPERPVQAPWPDRSESLPDPDAYLAPTLTEACTAPDLVTRPRKVRMLGWLT